MVTVQWIKNPDYYLDQSKADYYFAGGEPPGLWYGKALPVLSLAGVVTATVLRSLFAGKAADGRHLVQLQPGKQHQAAWDLTFSAPKPFSVLWSAARRPLRKALERVHNRAVKQALGYLQQVAAYTRRGKGGKTLEAVDLAFSLFLHCTSRDLDPQIHTHALLLNIGARADGTTGTILSKTIYDHKMVMGAVYQASLAQGLVKLGFTIRPCKTGFDIVGVPAELCREQSKRRTAIEQVLGSKNLSSAKASHIATLATRKAKQIPPRGELFEAWRKTNEQHGFTSAAIEKLLKRKRSLQRRRQKALAVDEQSAEAIVRRAIADLSERESHFTARDVYREALRDSIPYGVNVDELYAAVEQELATNLISLGRRDGYIRYTTKENLAIERKLLATIETLRQDRRHRVAPDTVGSILDRHLPLSSELSPTDLTRNHEQRIAVQHLTLNEGSVQVLAGMVGTGKTFTLGLCNKVWQKNGLNVRGLAVAGAAARRLEEGSGIKSDTLALFLEKLKHATEVHSLLGGKKCYISTPTKACPKGEVLIDSTFQFVLDEAALADTRQLAPLIAAVEACGAGLAMVGDRRQLQPVGCSGAMRAIEEQVGKAELSVITRQRNDEEDPQPQWQRDVVHHFATGNSVDALLLLAERGRVSVLDDHEAAKVALVRDWTVLSDKRPDQHLILAATNADVKDLNDLCQLALKQRDLIGHQQLRVGDEPLHIGDRVVLTKRSRKLGVENGDFGTVMAMNPRKKLLSIKLDRGPVVDVPVKDYQHVQRGYCTTVHKAQGASIERTSVLVGGSMQDLHQSYVQCSRHKQDCRLYTSKWEAGQLLEDLAVQMAQSREKVLALDILRENETSSRPRTGRYYELPETEPNQHRLELEKLDRLRGVFVPDEPRIEPPQKTKEEIQSLLQKLREQAIGQSVQSPSVTTKCMDSRKTKLRQHATPRTKDTAQLGSAELLPMPEPDETTQLQLRPRL